MPVFTKGMLMVFGSEYRNTTRTEVKEKKRNTGIQLAQSWKGNVI